MRTSMDILAVLSSANECHVFRHHIPCLFLKLWMSMTSMQKEEKEKRKNNKVLTIFRNLQPFIVLSYNRLRVSCWNGHNPH